MRYKLTRIIAKNKWVEKKEKLVNDAVRQVDNFMDLLHDERENFCAH